jgi:trk system potassium uptake protein TrkH
VSAALRRASAPIAGVGLGASFNLIGALLKYLSLAALMPAAIALGYSERAWPFVAAGAIAASVGWGLERVTQGKEQVGVREGFLVVSVTWLFAAGFGALPYLLYPGLDDLSNPLNAYFEAMSGFTTTGASIVTDLDSMPRSIAMWRQFTQWLGGMGIIVLALAVLPRLRIGGRQLLESELPGPEMEPLRRLLHSGAVGRILRSRDAVGDRRLHDPGRRELRAHVSRVRSQALSGGRP